MEKELKPLEALESIVIDLVPLAKKHNEEEIKIVEKTLKGLEILRKIIKLEGDYDFPEYQENDVVTKEEYDLLKEVLLEKKERE